MHERPLYSDEREYSQLAYHLASTGTYSYGDGPTAYRPVGYPLIAAAIYFSVGHHPLAIKFFQAILDVCTAYIIYLLLAGFTERTRILGSACWAFFPPAVFYTSLILSETVFASSLALLALLMLRRNTESLPRFVVMGILCGLLTLVKPGAFLILAVIALLWPKFGSRYRFLAILILGWAATTGPWLLRNYLTFGEFALSSNTGVNLLIGNNPNSTGAYGITFDPALLQGSRTEFETNQKAFHSAMAYIRDNPATFLVNAGKKLAHLFESEGGILVWTFHPNPEDTALRFRQKYASLSPPIVLLTNLSYFLILVAGIVGFCTAARDEMWWLGFGILSVWLVLHAIVFGGGRFLFPLIPFVILFAARCAAHPAEVLKNFTGWRGASALTSISLLTAVWIYEAFAIYRP
jgi:hypothetical protein